MFGKKASQASHRVETLIGAGTRIEGNIAFSGGLRIDGEVVGSIASAPANGGPLVVGPGGKVDGEVRVASAIVNGHVDGPMRVSGALELQPNARVSGEIRYNQIEMHQGAIVEGRLIHQPAGREVSLEEEELIERPHPAFAKG